MPHAVEPVEPPLDRRQQRRHLLDLRRISAAAQRVRS